MHKFNAEILKKNIYIHVTHKKFTYYEWGDLYTYKTLLPRNNKIKD